MNINRHADELEQLLRPQEPVERAELAACLRELRASLPETPPADVAEQHLAAITAAATEAAHSAPAAASTPPGRPWGPRVRRLAGLTAVKVAIGATAAAAATGTGLAATGNLPDPVQQVVSDAADRIGISIPAPTSPATLPDEAPTTVPPREVPAEDERQDAGDRPTPTPAQPDGSAPPAEVPGEGEPPADPSDLADDRDASGRDDVAPPRRPDGRTGPDARERATSAGQGDDRAPADADDPDDGEPAETGDDAEAPRAVTGDGAAPARDAVPALPLPETPRAPERADR